MKTYFSLPDEDLNNILSLAESDLFQLKTSHIFLTGGTSFFGKWLIESLLWANKKLRLDLDITVLSRDPSRFLNEMEHLKQFSNLSFIKGDILSFDISQIKPFTYLIHAANLLNDGTPDWSVRHMLSAVDGTHKLLSLAGSYGCHAALITSSGAVYRGLTDIGDIVSREDGHTECFRESSAYRLPLVESTIYSRTKTFIETLSTVLGQNNKVRTPIARCFSFIGPYMPLDGPQALGNFIRDAINEKQIIIKGDGSPLRSYLYASDLIVWLLAILVRGLNGRTYNIGSEESYSLHDIAKLIASKAPKEVTIHIQKNRVEGNAPNSYAPCIERIKNELGVKETIPFKIALKKTISWFNSENLK